MFNLLKILCRVDELLVQLSFLRNKIQNTYNTCIAANPEEG